MTEAAYMEQIVHLIAGAGVVLIVIVLIVVNGRVKVAKQLTLQKLLDKNQEIDVEMLVTLGLAKKDNPDSDFRRGILYVFMGAVITLVLMIMGGIGWIFGSVPVTMGLVYLGFWRLKTKPRRY
jgi:hypothetical protein